MTNKYTLGIETSCDDTSLALVDCTGRVLLQKRGTFDEDHRPFGGIVPERASRNHLKVLIPILEKLLEESGLKMSDLMGISVSNRPGLQGSLIVGLVTAKSLSFFYDLPLVGINHLEGHIFSPWLVDLDEKPLEIIYPHLSLIVSGGHSQLVLVESLGRYKLLGKTLDDAAGEALDKFSNSIGLGFPGGLQVDLAAQKGDAFAFSFPKPLINQNDFNFSFSGLKAAGFRKVEDLKNKNKDFSEKLIQDLCASYLESLTEVLVCKTIRALDKFKPKAFCVVGGVSANSILRAKFDRVSDERGLPFYKSKIKYCTDNGAMVAYAGSLRIQNRMYSESNLKTYARSLEGDFV